METRSCIPKALHFDELVRGLWGGK